MEDKLGEVAARFMRLRELERHPGNYAQPNLGSTADVLRPPFASPLSWVHPLTADTSRMVSVGFNRLPQAYQNLLKQIQTQRKVLTVPTHHPVTQYSEPDPGNRGWFFNPATQPLETLQYMRDKNYPMPEQPWMAVDEPKTATHELIHALMSHQSWWERPPRNTEEGLANVVAGTQGDMMRRISPAWREKLRELDYYWTTKGLRSPGLRGFLEDFIPTPSLQSLDR